MRVAFIGSRKLETHEDATLFYKIAYRFACLGITMTSGLAVGADSIAQEGFAKAIQEGIASTDQLEVYVNNAKAIEKSSTSFKEFSIIAPLEFKKETYAICEQVIPHWYNCNEYARSLHGRNCHQILGYDLKQPVRAVVCWTPNGIPSGGTNTAIQIALTKNIPVFNIGVKDKDLVLNDIKYFLQECRLMSLLKT